MQVLSSPKESQLMANDDSPITHRIDATKVEAATFSAILNGLSSGMFLVDADARMVHANAAGHAMLEAGGLFCVVDGRLVAADLRSDETLRTMFATAAALGVKGIAVQLMACSGERHVAHVLPLMSGERRRAGMDYAAV